MKELWLNFKDPDGVEKRVRVEGEHFTIGRHSASNLCILDSSLSREHVRIDRVGSRYEIDDPGSSNGTTINGKPVRYPEVINDGDEIVLGNSIAIRAELADAAADPPSPTSAAEAPDAEPPAIAADTPAELPATAAAASGGSISTSIFLIAPVLGLIVLVIIGGMIFLFSGRKHEVAASSDNEFQYSRSDDDPDDDPDRRSSSSRPDADDDDSVSTTAPTSSSSPLTTSPTGPTPSTGSSETGTAAQLPKNDTALAERYGGAFLRKIAQNDPRAFLTSEQAARVNSKIKQLSSSAAVVDNIRAAQKNSAQLRTLAASKRLKPDFLAIAAISRLGSSRGDVAKTAAGMADNFEKLAIQVNNESGDDALLMIAAYDQAVAGDFLKMRNMLQDLANKFPESARSIRSIWFLEKNGKITAAEFDAALTFLAIGTIAQNPKDFGVNAESLSF